MPKRVVKITFSPAVAMRRPIARCGAAVPARLLACCLPWLLAACASVAQAPQPVALPELQPRDEALFAHCAALPSAQARVLLQQLAQQNLEVQAAWQRVRVAQAQASQRAAERLPSLQLGVQGSRARSRPPQLGPVAGAGSFIIEQYEASVAAEYELDLWNRLGKTLEAAQWQSAAQRMDARTMAISLGAQLLESWYDLSYRLMQQQLIDAQIDTSQQLLELLKQRFVQGAGPVLDALQQKQQFTALQTALAENRAEIALQHQQLAVLLGREPGAPLAEAPAALPQMDPFDPAQSFSASALALRPDLRAGFYRVQAADAQLAAALAQRLPGVRLSGALFGQGAELSGVADGLLWRVAGSILQPLYDGGRIAARVDEADAARALQILQYRQLLLTALRELAAAWVAEQREATRVADLGRQRETAEKSYRLARQQYLRGAVDYLRVLNALQSMVDIQQQQLRAQRQRLSFRIQFCRALGADWLDSAAGPAARP